MLFANYTSIKYICIKKSCRRKPPKGHCCALDGPSPSYYHPCPHNTQAQSSLNFRMCVEFLGCCVLSTPSSSFHVPSKSCFKWKVMLLEDVSVPTCSCRCNTFISFFLQISLNGMHCGTTRILCSPGTVNAHGLEKNGYWHMYCGHLLSSCTCPTVPSLHLQKLQSKGKIWRLLTQQQQSIKFGPSECGVPATSYDHEAGPGHQQVKGI